MEAYNFLDYRKVYKDRPLNPKMEKQMLALDLLSLIEISPHFYLFIRINRYIFA